jgi:hypothetical protein
MAGQHGEEKVYIRRTFKKWKLQHGQGAMAAQGEKVHAQSQHAANGNWW